MNKKTMITIAVVVVITLAASDKLKALPLLKSIPTI